MPMQLPQVIDDDNQTTSMVTIVAFVVRFAFSGSNRQRLIHQSECLVFVELANMIDVVSLLELQ